MRSIGLAPSGASSVPGFTSRTASRPLRSRTKACAGADLSSSLNPSPILILSRAASAMAVAHLLICTNIARSKGSGATTGHPRSGPPAQLWSDLATPIRRGDGVGPIDPAQGRPGPPRSRKSDLHQQQPKPQRNPAFLKQGWPLPDPGWLDHRRRLSFLGGGHIRWPAAKLLTRGCIENLFARWPCNAGFLRPRTHADSCIEIR